jgi:hypothetical protein
MERIQAQLEEATRLQKELEEEAIELEKVQEQMEEADRLAKLKHDPKVTEIPYEVVCPDCGVTVKTKGLAIHRYHKHKKINISEPPVRLMDGEISDSNETIPLGFLSGNELAEIFGNNSKPSRVWSIEQSEQFFNEYMIEIGEKLILAMVSEAPDSVDRNIVDSQINYWKPKFTEILITKIKPMVIEFNPKPITEVQQPIPQVNIDLSAVTTVLQSIAESQHTANDLSKEMVALTKEFRDAACRYIGSTATREGKFFTRMGDIEHAINEVRDVWKSA